ncbi:transposase, IS605 OrfB family [Desulfurobacterium thermolithotrophum DSM 11699]|uniref:Transposase, IS605 OrfB family n=1 Tax=Desulfurobacterium thermolithotrophum (strain DSM 11699 / BSA) TaxID=868864 RepID=F0S1L8_DESTD|nr:RNA-guided endonuclease TnpB family protein [Desulfurobacterium thermolithotrophum]ADY74021.1 transposase, IS605 OrfB family [Desulfurobacterium thermolithotrophum DSM 11699]
MLLTLSISITKKSIYNKLEKASKTFQQFKNLLYLCALEYHKNTKDIKTFLSKTFLEKFVKDREKLPFENENIRNWKKELVVLWTEKIGSDTAKALVGVVAKEFKSILEKWKKGEKASLPKPRKLNTLYSFTLETNPNMVVDKRKLQGKRNSNHIVVRIGKDFGAVKFKVPESLKIKHIKINWSASGEVTYLTSYEVPKSEVILNKEFFLSIDLGVKNLISAVSNKEDLPSFIINGNPLKAFNQWVNKLSTKLQSEGKELEHKKLWNYRKKRIEQIFGMVSNFIVTICLKEGIGRVIISDSLTKEYKKEGTKGKRFNQEFRQIPLGKLIQKLEYKCKLAGIEFLKEPEPYTSQVSSITGNIKEITGKDKKEITEEDVKKLKITGKRIKRGLFKDLKLNKVFNADLNGALNIAIKKLGKRVREGFLKLSNWIDKLSRAVRITLFPHEKYSLSLFKEIRDSSSCLAKGSEGHLLTIANEY